MRKTVVVLLVGPQRRKAALEGAACDVGAMRAFACTSIY